MTPNDFKKRFLPKVTRSYLSETDKILFGDVYLALSNAKKKAIQKEFERGHLGTVVDLIQSARVELARTLAEARIDEIIADGAVDLETELDELL